MIAFLFVLVLGFQTVTTSDPGQPLILTPYIQKGQIEAALNASKVEPFLPGLQSWSGFITVNQTSGGNLFFWFVATAKNQGNAPLVIWLQGGPGSSSMFALFVENGPFQLDENLKVTHRETTWTSEYNMLWIDNPVGTGFSFVKDSNGYSRNEDQVAENLFNFMLQFYQLFPHLISQPFFISGESYAGKYVPAFAMKVAQMQNKTQGKLAKLTGILVGNGLSDPLSQIPPEGDRYYSLGLMNYQEKEYYNQQAALVIEYIQQGLLEDAYNVYQDMNGDNNNFVMNCSGCIDYYTLTQCTAFDPNFVYYSQFLTMNSTRLAIHVGSLPYNDGSQDVGNNLILDFMDTVKPRVEYLLNQTQVRVLYYSGNLDFIVPTVGTDAFLRSLNWPMKRQWLGANRTIVTDNDGEAVGYTTTVGQLSLAVVRNAGHMVPYDQPETTFSIVKKFISA